MSCKRLQRVQTGFLSPLVTSPTAFSCRAIELHQNEALDPTQSVVQWLEGLGLGQYSAAFVQADVDTTLLPDLTDADLEKLGVTLGHRNQRACARGLLRGLGKRGDGAQQPLTGRFGSGAPTDHGDVLRSYRLDGAFCPARRRGSARRNRGLPELRRG